MKQIILFAAFCVMLLQACQQSPSGGTVRVGENAFVHNNKVYTISGAEVKLLADLSHDSITKIAQPKAELRNFGRFDIEGENDAFTEVSGIYRNEGFNFRLEIKSFKDLHEKFTDGKFVLRFSDRNSFPVAEITIPLNSIPRFEYSGRIEMSYSDYMSIDKYSVSAELVQKEEPKKERRNYDSNDWY